MIFLLRKWAVLTLVLVCAILCVQAQEEVRNLDVLLTEALFGYYLKSPEGQELFRLNSLNSEIDISGESENCPINTFELAGQKLRIKGGGSGNDQPSVNPAKLYNDYANLPGRFNLFADLNQTTFVVIDDFSGTYAHGRQVLEHLLVLLWDTSNVPAYLNQVASIIENLGTSSSTTLNVVGSTIQTLNHQNEANTLHDLIQSVNNLPPENRTIVNMSFSLIPCATRNDAKTDGIEVYETFKQYQDAL